jgi:hypothetical protein
MSDSLKYAQKGEPLAIKASTWNAFIDTARDAKFRKRQPERWQPGQNNSTIVKVKNVTGDGLSQFSVLSLSGPVFDADDNLDEFKQNAVAEANAPSVVAAKEVVAVLAEALPEDGIGRATILGLTPVKIQVGALETGWKWADVESGNTTRMVMKEDCGVARVIWKQSGTGEKWAYVCLLGPPCGSEGVGGGLEECDFGSLPGFDPDSLVDGVPRIDSDGCMYIEYPAECVLPVFLDAGTIP